MNISERLKEAIKAHGYTLAQVASQMKNERAGAIGISQPSLSDMLKGNIPFSRVEEICRIINASLSELVADESNASATCPHCGKPITIKTTIE